MPLIPLRDLLYIIPLEPKLRQGPVYLARDPDRHYRPTQGIVKYRGPLTSGEIRVGDHVVFSGYDGDVLVLEGEGSLILMPEDEVLAVIKDGEDSRLYTFDQLQREVEEAAATLMTHSGNSELVQELRNRIVANLKDKFARELYF